jgi:hypothetical protein
MTAQRIAVLPSQFLMPIEGTAGSIISATSETLPVLFSDWRKPHLGLTQKKPEVVQFRPSNIPLCKCVSSTQMPHYEFAVEAS